MDYEAMWIELKEYMQDSINFYSTDTAIIKDSFVRAQNILLDTTFHRAFCSILETMSDIEIEHTK